MPTLNPSLIVKAIDFWQGLMLAAERTRDRQDTGYRIQDAGCRIQNRIYKTTCSFGRAAARALTKHLRVGYQLPPTALLRFSPAPYL